MPDPKIKWRAGEREQIAREVKRFNAKVEREARKAGNIVPPKMETRNVRAMIKTRADFNAFKKLVENAFKQDAFKEGKSGSTKYERAEVLIRTAILNRAQARKPRKERKEGEKLGSEYQNSLKPKKAKTLSKLGKRKEQYLASLRKQTSGDYNEFMNNLYINNYLAACDRFISYPYISQIHEALRRIPAEAFIAAKEDGNEFDINWVYDNREDTSLGYKILRALEKLMDDLGITHKAGQYDPMDVQADIGNFGADDWEPWED